MGHQWGDSIQQLLDEAQQGRGAADLTLALATRCPCIWWLAGVLDWLIIQYFPERCVGIKHLAHRKSTAYRYILLRECCGFLAAANLISAIPVWSPQKSFSWILFLVRNIDASCETSALKDSAIFVGLSTEGSCELWYVWDLSRKIPRTVLNILNSSKNTEPRSLSKTAHTLKGIEHQDGVLTHIFFTSTLLSDN